MKKIALFFVLMTKLIAQDDFVVCIHGLFGGKWCMEFLAKNLRQDHWNVVNWSYPSADDYINNHGENLVKELQILAQKRPNKPIHFVTHSMGSLVLLSALNHKDAPMEAKIGRIVLIAPPLRGSAFAKWLGKFSISRKFLKGYSGQELMTLENCTEKFGNYPESIEKILIIAGSLGFNPLLKKPNDGTIAVTETILPTPHDHVVVNSGHKTIFYSKKVSRLTRAFLNGSKST